jgi:hypothetical protein
MGFMENVFPRPPSGIFYVKKDIPADVRHAFGGKSAIWKSLGTKRKAEARAKVPDILDKIENEIAAARACARFDSFRCGDAARRGHFASQADLEARATARRH